MAVSLEKGLDEIMAYGKELVLDLNECDPTTFNTRAKIEQFCNTLCSMIHVEPKKLVFWDYAGFPEEYAEAPDRIKGTSAVQFLLTSNITIHTLDVFEQVLLNIFSCDEFDDVAVRDFCKEWFNGSVERILVIERGV